MTLDRPASCDRALRLERAFMGGHDGAMAGLRRVIATGAAAVGAITLAAAGVQAFTPADSGGIPLSAVPQGVSAYDIAGRQVFLVRQGNRVTGFLRTSPFAHTSLLWCTADDLFMAPAWGERFDIVGRAMSGHAPRNMDRVRVVVHPSNVSVDATVVTKGAAPTASERQQANVDWFAAHKRTPPVDYCSPTIPS
jgi:Rieske Fe-S protein